MRRFLAMLLLRRALRWTTTKLRPSNTGPRRRQLRRFRVSLGLHDSTDGLCVISALFPPCCILKVYTLLLQLPDFNKMLELECDASGIGLGGVLLEDGITLAKN
jgi:hypothetical protein